MARPFVLAAFGTLLIAIVTQQPAMIAVALLLFGLVGLANRLPRLAIRNLAVTREMPTRAFLGEPVHMSISLCNTGLVPATWLNLRDSVPTALNHTDFRQVISLGGYERRTFNLSMLASRRGLYEIGPLSVSIGDVFGLGKTQSRNLAARTLTIYPRMVGLDKLDLPSRLLLGNTRNVQPIHDDPSRLRGKRDFIYGDSLRRVDWKTTAAVGRMQVKQFEPTRTHETMLVLDLDLENYDRRGWVDDSELAIVMAASVGRWCAQRQQSVGMMTNGRDPGITASLQFTRPAAQLAGFATIPPRAGQRSLIRVLDVLARVRTSDLPSREQARTESLALLVRTARTSCTWGSTLVIITCNPGEALWQEVIRAPAAGLSVVLMLCGSPTAEAELRRRAAQFGVAVHIVRAIKEVVT